MSTNPEAVRKWREQTKTRIVEAFNGKCGICGYDKCHDALVLHHLDPKEKDFKISNMRANPVSWDKIVTELRKCICLCNRCHSEYHAGLINIPNNIQRFNEEYCKYQHFKKDENDQCPICGQMKWKYSKTCSLKCAAKKSHRVDWDNINLKELLKTRPITKIASDLNISDTAVRKRMKKLGLKQQYFK